MAQDKEKFLDRWARLKQQSKELPEKKDDSPAPPLPALDKLTPESDFTGFMHPKVEQTLRRAALKKLFSDPHFNVPDPFEAYSGDWTGGEPISEEMLATLNQARDLIFRQDEKDKTVADAGSAKEEEPRKDDETGSKDA